jgi:hypothetical protein
MIAIRLGVRSVHFAPRRNIIQWQEKRTTAKRSQGSFSSRSDADFCCGRQADPVTFFSAEMKEKT